MQTSGETRREIAKSYLRRMGRAKRNPSLTGTEVSLRSTHPTGRHDAERMGPPSSQSRRARPPAAPWHARLLEPDPQPP